MATRQYVRMKFPRPCRTCKVVKGKDEFHVHLSSKLVNGERCRRSDCKDCSRASFRANRKKWIAEHPEENAVSVRRTVLKRYGMTIADHDAMIKKQNGVCVICGDPPGVIGRWSTLHIDHDHATGKVRGLLCHGCNVGLGLFRDSSKFLKNAARYLDERGEE